MVFTDPISDMLTRIRNGLTAHLTSVSVPASKEKLTIANILVKEGYIVSAEEASNNGKKNIIITLKYDEKSKPVISNLKRVSRPGLRNYCKAKNLPQVLGGLGVAVVSTSKGLLTDRKARKENLGGEVLAYIY